jgi:hypothetical protein
MGIPMHTLKRQLLDEPLVHLLAKSLKTNGEARMVHPRRMLAAKAARRCQVVEKVKATIHRAKRKPKEVRISAHRRPSQSKYPQ